MLLLVALGQLPSHCGPPLQLQPLVALWQAAVPGHLLRVLSLCRHSSRQLPVHGHGDRGLLLL